MSNNFTPNLQKSSPHPYPRYTVKLFLQVNKSFMLISREHSTFPNSTLTLHFTLLVMSENSKVEHLLNLMLTLIHYKLKID